MEHPIPTTTDTIEHPVGTVRKTFQHKPQPSPGLKKVLRRCHTRYNTALEQRLTWWRWGKGEGANRFQLEAELKNLREALAACAALHSHVLQDVLAHLARTYQAFSRWVQAGEKAGAAVLQQESVRL